MMSQIVLDIPDESLLALNVPADRAGEELRLIAAMKLYEMGKMSSGAAAGLAGIPRTTFLARLGDFGIPTFRQSKEELEAEARLG